MTAIIEKALLMSYHVEKTFRNEPMRFKEILKHTASVRHPAAYVCKNKSGAVVGCVQ